MSTDLNSLGTGVLQDAVDFDHLPEERGSYPPPPTPGAYRFALSPLGDNFKPVKSEKYGERVSVRFNSDAPLVIVQSPGNLHNGEPFETSISNVPRMRGKGENAAEASDWDYLNKALGINIPKGERTNKKYAETLIAAAATGAQFSADIEWSWSCNDQRDAYFADGNGGTAPVADANNPGNNLKGCGAKHYQGTKAQAATVDGETKKAGYVIKQVDPQGGPAAYPLHIECTACGASVRAFGNLARIRA